MYKLTIRNQEPVFIEDEQGDRVFNAWTEKNGAKPLPTKVSIKGLAFYSADIRAISRITKGEAETADKTDKQEDEYLTYRKKMLGLSLEQRANIMRIPNIIWKSVNKAEMPENIKTEIKKRQLAYFKENEKCIYANPKIYRDLIPKALMLKQLESMSPIQNIMPSALLRLLQNLIQTDLQFSVR